MLSQSNPAVESCGRESFYKDRETAGVSHGRSRNEAHPGSLLQEARGLREHQNEINRRLNAIAQALCSTPSEILGDGSAKEGPMPDLVAQIGQVGCGMNMTDSHLDDIERYVFGVAPPASLR